MKPHIAPLVIGLCLAIAAPAHAVHGRAYVETERLIVRMTKQMVQQRKNVDAFVELVRELDTIDLAESTRDFWRTAHAVKNAMAEEVRQGHALLEKGGASIQRADVSGAAGGQISSGEHGTKDNPLAGRVNRMELIMLETDGLRNPLSMNDESAIARYRLLVGEFHSLLKADVDEMQGEIDALKEKQRAAKG